ncbi:MAG: LLM class F420-dependent oxidoreductase [Acidimicrobiia bacterium]|nr:LLM class F420-dependent oxidoreductase [Acidimicrobiia bacterium]MBT8250235.1 LLM class F420-dependent oxidoreductase [Acidimicrobiia bacterium]NNL28398.1 LLM class F420-dependent oxidoreductase [Acidimicrobiia bacterium]
MKIAAHLHPQHATYDEIRKAVVRVEDMGVDVVYNWDHFYPLYGDASGKHFEAWTMLASWAEITSEIQIGCLVTCNSYRNANLLADMARTVDHIADGRLIFGIGSGWFEKDYDEYGYEFGTAGGRLDQLAESLPIIRDRFEKLNPPPVGPMPILIGGGGERKTLRYTAQYADIWHFWWNQRDPSIYQHKDSVLKEWCEKEGRDSEEILRSVGVDRDKDPITPRLLDDLLAAGVGEVTLGFNGPDYDLSPLKSWIDWRDSL